MNERYPWRFVDRHSEVCTVHMYNQARDWACSRPAVAAAFDENGDIEPVCDFHVAGQDLVPLADLLDHTRAATPLRITAQEILDGP